MHKKAVATLISCMAQEPPHQYQGYYNGKRTGVLVLTIPLLGLLIARGYPLILCLGTAVTAIGAAYMSLDEAHHFQVRLYQRFFIHRDKVDVHADTEKTWRNNRLEFYVNFIHIYVLVFAVIEGFLSSNVLVFLFIWGSYVVVARILLACFGVKKQEVSQEDLEYSRRFLDDIRKEEIDQNIANRLKNEVTQQHPKKKGTSQRKPPYDNGLRERR